MPCITRCCCWDLRTGSVVTSFYSMIYAVLAIGMSSFEIHRAKLSESTEEQNAFFIATCIDLIFFSLLFVFSIVLVYGAKNGKRYTFIPYLVCMTILVILQVVLLILLVIILLSIGSTGVVVEIIIIGVLTFVNIYCIMCVVSYFQDLRDGRAGMRAVYRAHGTTIPHVDVPTTTQSEKCGGPNNFVPQYPGPPLPGATAAPYPGPPAANYPGPPAAGAGVYIPTVEFGAPPPYQPPEYPKTELQTV